MTCLLDTNAVSDLMKSDSRIHVWLNRLSAGDRVIICPIVRGEIIFGILRLPLGRRRAELEDAARQTLPLITCVPVPGAAADIYADLKSLREKQGIASDENDLWIASTALATGAGLVTRDGDFSGIPNLVLVDPAQPS